MNCLAIIPARGGSKRIPLKNIKDFCGKPIISYPIDACRKSNVFSNVIVSTDDKNIFDISVKNCASAMKRSNKNSGDLSTTVDVLLEVLDERWKLGFYESEIICCVYPCSPFLTVDDLKSAYLMMISSGADAIQSVCKYPVPIEWAFNYKDGYLKSKKRKYKNIRSQDIKESYYDAGQFYFIRRDVLLKEKTLTPKKTIGYILEQSQVQDIDTIDDWNN